MALPIQQVAETPAELRKTRRFVVKSPSGDDVEVSITPTGQVRLRAANGASDFANIRVKGLTRREAVVMKKGFWGKLWDKIKAAADAVKDMVTFDAGGAKCRPDVDVTMTNGRPTGGTVGVACTN